MAGGLPESSERRDQSGGRRLEQRSTGHAGLREQHRQVYYRNVTMRPAGRRMQGALALALVVRLAAWLTVSPTRLASDEDSYVAVANGLLADGHQDLFWPPVTGWL